MFAPVSRPYVQSKAWLACQILNTCLYETYSESLADAFSLLNRFFFFVQLIGAKLEIC